jgi:hypothetical protein
LDWGFIVVVLTCVGNNLWILYLLDLTIHMGNGTAFPEALPWLRRPLEVLGPAWLVTAFFPIVPVLIVAAIGGGELGRMRTQPEGPICSTFLATRPIRVAQMVQAKLLVSAGGVLVLWAFWMGQVGEMTDRLVGWTGSGLAAVAALIGGLALLAVLSWLLLIRNLWVGALGRPVLEVVPSFAAVASLVIVAVLAANWRDAWRPVLGGVMGVALAGKVLALGWVVRRLRRERLMSDRALGLAVAAWGLLAALVVGGALYLGGLLYAGGAILLLPLARPLAGPLALAHNRTR